MQIPVKRDKCSRRDVDVHCGGTPVSHFHLLPAHSPDGWLLWDSIQMHEALLGRPETFLWPVSDPHLPQTYEGSGLLPRTRSCQYGIISRSPDQKPWYVAVERETHHGVKAGGPVDRSTVIGMILQTGLCSVWKFANNWGTNSRLKKIGKIVRMWKTIWKYRDNKCR